MSSHKHCTPQVIIRNFSKKYKVVALLPQPKVFESTHLHFINEDNSIFSHPTTQSLIFKRNSFKLLDLNTHNNHLFEDQNFTLEARFSSGFKMNKSLVLHTQSVKSFFVSQQVDTPISLRLGNSKYRPDYIKPVQQLISLLTSSGQHRRITLYFLHVYNQLSTTLLDKTNSTFDNDLQKALLHFILLHPTQTLLTQDNQVDDFNSGFVFSDQLMFLNFKYGHSYLNEKIYLHQSFIAVSALFDLLKRFLPIFSMKTKKVDKLKFKHSRGKSGKYSVDWAYIPRYNRLKVVMRWLVNDVKFQKSTSFTSRLLTSLKTLFLAPNDHLVFKNRSYVHKVVYTKYKSTLLRTLTIKRA